MENVQSKKMVDLISHDMKTQLSTITMAVKNIELVLSGQKIEKEVRDEIKQVCTIASESSLNMKEDIDTIIALNKILKPRNIIFNEILESVIERIIRENNKINLVRNFNETYIEILTDYRALKLAMNYLFNGFIEYLAKSGEIKIKIVTEKLIKSQKKISIIFELFPSQSVKEINGKFEKNITLARLLLQVVQSKITEEYLPDNTYRFVLSMQNLDVNGV